MADKTIISQFDGVMVRVGQRFHRVDRGALVPDNADADHVQVLQERGMVVEGEPFAGLTHETVGPVAFDVAEDAKSSKSGGKAS